MRLLFECESCGAFYKLHAGSLSSIPFARLPQLILQASQHKCPKREAA